MGNTTYQIHESDLLKIRDALLSNLLFHKHRDWMNSNIHLAKECRYSPITSETISAFERLDMLLQGQHSPLEQLTAEGEG